jgi:hypothetical protein
MEFLFQINYLQKKPSVLVPFVIHIPLSLTTMFICQSLIVVKNAIFSGSKVVRIDGKKDGDQKVKITKKQLKQIIKEELEAALKTEGEQTLISTTDISQPDPNDNLFKLMDKVTDMALDKIGKRDDREAEAEISPLSNEIVTARLADIEGMANEVIRRYEQGYKGETYE